MEIVRSLEEVIKFFHNYVTGICQAPDGTIFLDKGEAEEYFNSEEFEEFDEHEPETDDDE